MSVVEADLDDDGGLGEEAYLDALVERAPPAATLLNDVGRLQIVKGFVVFAAPDDAPRRARPPCFTPLPKGSSHTTIRNNALAWLVS